MFLNAQGHALAQRARAKSTPMNIDPVQLFPWFPHAQEMSLTASGLAPAQLGHERGQRGFLEDRDTRGCLCGFHGVLEATWFV